MGGFGVHFGTVGVGIAQDVACKLNHHHLHAETDAEGGFIVLTAIASGQNFTLCSTLSEARADDDALHGIELFGDVVFVEFLAVDEVRFHFVVIVCA